MECEEISLADAKSTQQTAGEDEGLKLFHDGFLLPDEDTLERNEGYLTDKEKTEERNVPLDLPPVIDIETETGKQGLKA